VEHADGRMEILDWAERVRAEAGAALLLKPRRARAAAALEPAA
jgi:hypothetical protein